MLAAVLTEPACVRKPTRPALVAPVSRPVSNQVEATGSRKLPSLPQPSAPVETTTKRDVVAEAGLLLDLALSDDSNEGVIQALPLPQKPRPNIIVIPPQQGLSRCKHQFVKGTNKGSFCGKKCIKHRNLCAVHSGIQEKKVTSVGHSDEMMKKLSETNAKLKMLETVVLKLMKN